MRIALLLTSLLLIPMAAATAHVDVYHDEDRLRSGVEASVGVGDCSAYFWAEYFDNDGDHIPDSVPPGGPPPRFDRGVGC